MKLLLPLIALLCTSVPAIAQEPGDVELRIDGIFAPPRPYLGNSIVMAPDPVGEFRWALYIIRETHPSEFTMITPKTLLLNVSSAQGPSQVITGIFTSPEGIRLIIQTPCRRYTSFKACNRAHRKAVLEMLKEWGIDPKATGEGKIVIPKINDAVTPNIGGIVK